VRLVNAPGASDETLAGEMENALVGTMLKPVMVRLVEPELVKVRTRVALVLMIPKSRT
jgi:hypothetical protein